MVLFYLKVLKNVNTEQTILFVSFFKLNYLLTTKRSEVLYPNKIELHWVLL